MVAFPASVACCDSKAALSCCCAEVMPCWSLARPLVCAFLAFVNAV